MSTEERIEKLDYLYFLIERKSAGVPKDTARKLGVSIATLTRYIDFLEKLKGVTIEYSRARCSYEITSSSTN